MLLTGVLYFFNMTKEHLAVGIEGLPVEMQEEISSYLSFMDCISLCKSSRWISPSVLSYRKSPTVDDLELIKDDPEIFKHVLKNSKITSQTLQSFINQHSKSSHKDVFKMLLEDPRIDPSADYNYSIRVASENGHTEIVEMLLHDPRVDPSAWNNYAIRNASENGHTEIVEMLLKDSRVDASAYGFIAVKYMYFKREYDLVIEMICKGLKKEKRDLTIEDLNLVFKDNEKAEMIYKLLKLERSNISRA
jgi:hypothetical protein